MKKLVIISILGFFCLKVSAQGTVNGHEYVDLGLSVKWATCNYGANSPDEYGLYFDHDKALGACKYWGGSWRLPTSDEMDELLQFCTWTWMTKNGKNGYKVTGPNGKSIFLPAAGYCYGSSLDDAGRCGYYWSSSPIDGYSGVGWSLYFDSFEYSVHDNYYSSVFSVRPVIK